MKKVLALVLALCLALSLAACGGSGSSSSTPAASGSGSEPAASTTPTAAGSVYYLNFKPEQDEAWQALAKAYTAETGVPVTVVTAASGEYETTLMAEMGKSEAPTLFQVNGPVGLANWKDYCYDLSGSDIYTQLTSDDYALKEGDTVYGIAYVIESYGIITNKTLLEKAGYTLEDIQSFEDLKKVAEDITSRKDELGFAAFTSAGMDGSSTGASRPIWPTCPFTLNIRKMASAPPTPSRAHIWTITRPSGICISTTAPASPVSCPPKPATTPAMSFWPARPCSSRTAPGSTAT